MQPQEPTNNPSERSGNGAYQAPPEQNPQLPNSPVFQQPPTSPYQETKTPDQMQPNRPSVANPLQAMQPGEQILCEIKPHPIGIIGTYVSLGLAVVLVAVIGFVIVPQMFTSVDTSRIFGYTALAILIVVVIGGLFAYIAHVVYWGNRWIVTDDSVTQVVQNSLFNKRSSQLSMGNLEDVTAEQNGILSHMFNYGVLKAETAGEHSKFRFMYCPNPNFYAQCILNAREKFEGEHYRNGPAPAYPDINQQSDRSS